MGKITKIDEIIQKIQNGVSRNKLENEYNKGTVTKAYNKFQETQGLSSDKKENQVKNILQNLFASIDESEEYEINIIISKKTTNKIKSTKEKKKLDIIENPFEIYNALGRDEYLNKLIKTKRDDLEKIIKKYFSLNKKEKSKYTIKKLADYIVSEVERNLNIGECFK